MVNKERVRKLVEALRSGEYTQGFNQLTTVYPDGTERDCCLGVACKVAMADGLKVDTKVLESTGRRIYDNCSGVLPDSVAEYYGFPNDDLDNSNPILKTADGERVAAATMNDHLGLPFGIIADAFERTYLTE